MRINTLLAEDVCFDGNAALEERGKENSGWGDIYKHLLDVNIWDSQVTIEKSPLSLCHLTC
jgi:hypothetical protein